MKAGMHTQRRGFTLIELLVVITIMALLAGAVLVLTDVFAKKGDNTKAKTDIEMLSTALTKYESEGYKLEDGSGDLMSAHALYCMTSGDYDEDGIPDEVRKGARRTKYCPSLVIIDPGDESVSDGIPVMKSQSKLTGLGKKQKGKKMARYVIIDPWGNPYRYRLGFQRKGSNKKYGSGNNADFDIFSQGPDGLGNGLDDKGENEDNISNVEYGK